MRGRSDDLAQRDPRIAQLAQFDSQRDPEFDSIANAIRYAVRNALQDAQFHPVLDGFQYPEFDSKSQFDGIQHAQFHPVQHAVRYGNLMNHAHRLYATHP